jgi:diguanylate cyclase (GGDEF)-like protein
MLSAWRNNTARRPWRISAKLLIISSVVTVIGFSAICVNVMLDMRRGEEALARQTLENLATSIDADISRNIDIYDLSLKAVASNMLLPEINTVHRDNPNAGLFISRPMLFRGAYSIVLSRRVSDTDGGFMGVVAGSIRFTYFHELFERLSLDPEDTITVLKRDRTIMMRRPFDLDIIGRNLGTQQEWKPDNLKAGGSYAGMGPVDVTPRLYVRSSGSGPLFVVAGKPLRAVFELWQKEALRIGAVVLVLSLFVLGSAIVLAREISRRADAESKLEEMATTDALTGLRNRRKFDHVIDSEWRRAMRQKTPVALLMIDADHFKAYNDTFGHQAGDQVLVGIAICISDSVRRAGDCAARYGGEEFAVLLPDTSATDAFKIAETIRAKVLGWSEGGAGSTVSCGIASLAPTSGMDWAILVAAADKALYAAKAGGRNQSVVASLPKLSLVA